MTSQFKSLKQVIHYFKDETTCKAYLAKQRWGDTPSCPHCGNVGAYVTNRGFKCKAKECAKKFSVTSGTIFENTKIPLSDWFAAIYLATAHKKGISSLQLSRDLNITQKSAWFILHRVREMLTENAPEMLTGTVEVDETYVGGATKNKSNKKRAELRLTGGQYFSKTSVVAMLERESGTVQTTVFKANSVKTSDVLPIIQSTVGEQALIITDSSTMYGSLKQSYKHEVVNHVQKEYVRGAMHTNTIEGFFSQLKRGIVGVYHFVSTKHLHRYCHEFGYRYNTRKILDPVRFEGAIKNVNGKRLTYKKLIA
ncbi:IS1595 family transposase [Mucilaginibacter boryungensis]|uniref:IS1595 family transposase n=1 Tax=Mucilaginibacter boryungensis TaxID=768480 RepID=A0ABR9XCE6_9SPHI|nr:IS1595 family transposase [Mucilaginibacter boryungensis]MBE9665069.1 IS1595 family transposase [Mucilaginibacter boryungensis]